jgi:predicted nucleic acid-binding protein
MGPRPVLSIYLDTSFLVSLYSVDANSIEASQTLQGLPDSVDLLLSMFSELEVVNALQLRLFRKQDSSAQVQLALGAFDDDLATGRFRLRALPEHVFQRARQLSLQTTARVGTRSSDLLHVAAALELGAGYFYSFDNQQRKLAQSLQLKLNNWG